MEDDRVIVCSENGQNQLEFSSMPFRYKLIKNSEVFLDCRGGDTFIRRNSLILNPSMIAESRKENHETLLKISLENSELFLILSISSFKGNFKLKWHLHKSSEAIDLGMRYLLQPDEKLYGCGELSVQQWPLNKPGNEIALQDFTTRDPFNNVVSPIWLTSRGLGLIHPTYAAMSYYQNHGGDDTFHLEMRNVHVCEQILIAETNLHLAFSEMVDYVGRPVKAPPKGLFTDPVWTTWVEYKMDVSQEKVMRFATMIQGKGYPFSVIEIDDRWQKEYGDSDFDFSKFPDPKKMVEELHAMGFKVTLWVMPFVNKASSHYQEGVEHSYFVKESSSSFMDYDKEAATASVKWWQGTGALVDFTNMEASSWFVNHLKTLSQKYGIDGFKFDAGEGCYLDGTVNASRSIPAAFSDQYIESVSQHFEYMEARTGWLSQKQPVFIRQFDKFSKWGLDNGLHSVLTQALAMSITGYPFILPDMIGGNQYGNTCGKELFIRWAELNALLPSMQYSITPWSIDDETSWICLKYTQLHQLFGDEIYQHALNYLDGGLPIVSSLNLIDPHNPINHDIDDQFIVCGHILVAPVVKEDQCSRQIYLPQGDWYNPWDAKHYSEKQFLEMQTPLHVLPFFLEAKFLEECRRNGTELLEKLEKLINEIRDVQL